MKFFFLNVLPTLQRGKWLVTAFFCLQFSTIHAQCPENSPKRVPMGGMLQSLNDAVRDRPFNDVFKLNRGFVADTNNALAGRSAPVDGEGWATSDFSVIVLTDMTADLGGIYKMRFRGRAQVRTLLSSGIIRNQRHDTLNNLTTAEIVFPTPVIAGDKLILSFSQTRYNDSQAGVKNIQIMRPTLDFDAPTFNTKFLSSLNRFSVLNFSNWRNAAGNSDSLWTGRTLPATASQVQRNGVAWEYVVELANTMNRDIWVSVPHKADDIYAVNLAQLLKSRLNANLKIYVEYGSEPGNFRLETARFNTEASDRESRLANCPFNPDRIADRFTLNSRRYAYKSKRVNDIFKDAFANDPTRVRTIYAAETNWFAWSKTGLEFMAKYYGAPSNYYHAIAIAPYVSILDSTAVLNEGQILATLRLQAQAIFKNDSCSIETWAARAAYHQLPLMAFSAGIDTEGDRNIVAKRNAVRSTAIRPIVDTLLRNWYAYGKKNLLIWNAAGAGSWETTNGTFPLTENFENSEKAASLDVMIADSLFEATAGQSVLQAIDPRRISERQRNWAITNYFQPSADYPATELLVRVPRGESGKFRLNIPLRSAVFGESFRVYFDGRFIDTVRPTVTATFRNLTTPLTLGNVGEGFHTLRFEYISTNFQIDTMRFVKYGACATGTEDWEKIENTYKISPNPVADALKIEFEAEYTGGGAFLEIFDLLGKKMWQQKVDASTSIDVSSFPQGIFIYQIKNFETRKIQIGKFLKR